MPRSRAKRGKDARYERAVRRQIEFNRGLEARRIPYTPVEEFLRPGDSVEDFLPPALEATAEVTQ